MGGGWVGYVYVFFGCGVVLFLLGGSTLLLYGWARIARRRGVEPTVRVTTVRATTVTAPGGGPDASSAG